MYGTLEKVWANKRSDGTPYWTLSISGRRYSVWDGNLVEGLQEGDGVEFSFTQSGAFRKVVAIHKSSGAGSAGNPWLQHQEEKGTQIVRMSCIRTAAQLVDGSRGEPLKKADLVLRVATLFEEHVQRGRKAAPGAQEAGS
jgi:hypothetical protein